MKTAIIFGRPHGGKKLEIISGPDVPLDESKKTFKEFRRSPVHKQYEHVQIHYLRAQGDQSVRLHTPKAHAEKQKQLEQETRLHEKHAATEKDIHTALSTGELDLNRKSLADKTKEELTIVCRELGIEPTPGDTKDDLIRAILKHQKQTTT